MKSIKILLALLILSVYAKAQSELTLPFMTDVFQSTYTNPSIMPEHSVSVGLPINVSFQAINTGLIFNDFVKYKNDTTTGVNINNMYDGLKEKNMLYMGENLDIFHLRFKVQNAFYWFAIREHFNTSLFYAKDLFSIVMEGTTPYVGKSLDFTNMQLKSNAYMEYTLGMSMSVKKWAVGARLSLLKGVANVDFSPEKLELQIDDETWANTAVADAEFRTSGVPKDSNGDIGVDNFDFDWVKENVLKSKNNGIALSAGFTYQFDEQLKVGFSFYDVGFINWKNELETYKLKGRFELKGLDVLSGFLNGEGMKLDTLFSGFKDAFDVDTIEGATYKTWLNPKFNLALSYRIAPRTVINALFNATYNTKIYPTFTVGLSQGIGRFFNLSADFSFAYRSLMNFGVGLVVKPGPVQFFVALDNYYPLMGNEQLLSFTNMNARVGINLVFGRVSKPDGMPLW